MNSRKLVRLQNFRWLSIGVSPIALALHLVFYLQLGFSQFQSEKWPIEVTHSSSSVMHLEFPPLDGVGARTNFLSVCAPMNIGGKSKRKRSVERCTTRLMCRQRSIQSIDFWIRCNEAIAAWMVQRLVTCSILRITGIQFYLLPEIWKVEHNKNAFHVKQQANKHAQF